MIDLSTVTTREWIGTAAAAAIILFTYLANSQRLPSWVRRWLRRIGAERIFDAIEHAGAMAELSPDTRRKQAVIYLRKLCVKELGFPVPASIANLLVEFVYQKWKHSRR